MLGNLLPVICLEEHVRRTNSENQLKKISRDHPVQLPNFRLTGIRVDLQMNGNWGWRGSVTQPRSHGRG